MPIPIKLARRSLLFAALAVLVPAPGFAATPVEDAITAWLASVNATPGWHATDDDVAVDAASGVATISNLTVKSDQPGFDFSVGSIRIDGFHPSSDPVFTADRIDLTDLSLTVGDYGLNVPSTVVAAPALPKTGGFAWDPAVPILSSLHVLAALTHTAAASVKAPSLTLTETYSGMDSDTSYTNVSLIGWRNGKIAAGSSGPMKSASPAKDPLVTLSATGAETRDIDLDALLAVLDPARYPNGAGDGTWRQVVGHSADHGVTIALPGITLTVADTAADGIRLRQSKTPPDYGKPADASQSLLDHALHRLDEIGNIAVARFAVTGVGGNIPGVADARLDSLTLSNLEGEKVGDFTLAGLAVTLANNGGAVSLAKFGIGGLALPAPDAIRAAAASPANVDYASLAPQISYIEADKLNVALPSVLTASLDRLRLDLGDYAGVLPKTIGVDLAGLDLPAWLIPSDRARELLARFGYDELHLDAGTNVDATVPGEIAVKDFHAAMKGAGGIVGSADLAGSLPSDIAGVRQALSALALKDGTVTMTDDSIVGRLLAAQAQHLKVDPEKFRDQFAASLPLMLMLLNNRDLQTRLTPALQGFVRNGGTFTVSAKPSAPVPLAELASTATGQPFTLFGLLSADVSGVPGPQPTPIPTLPAVAAVAPPPTVPDTSATDDSSGDQMNDNGDQPDNSGNAPGAAPDTGNDGSN